MRSSCSWSSLRPLTRPAACTFESFTYTSDPFGKTVSLSTTIGSSNDPLNVSPTRAVSESTESIIRTATSVPEGTVICRGAGGSTRSGLTSSTGGAGTGTGGATGAGNVNVPGADDAVLETGAGAGAFTTRGAGLAVVCCFGFTGCGRGASTTGAAAGCGWGAGAGAGAAAGAGAGSCDSAALPCSFGIGSGPQADSSIPETRMDKNSNWK